MNFVISNVTTVEEEDDEEPLYEIKKVSIVKEQRETESRVRVTTYKKSCYVPLCPNSSVATPEKMFITVPVNPARRKYWLEAAGKTGGKNPKSPMFCCQDHFNLEADMINYQEYLKRGKVQMRLDRAVVPHIFICNQYGHLKRKERIEVLQKLHKDMNYNALSELDEQCVPTIPEKRETPRQKAMRAAKRRKLNHKVEDVKANKTVFIEMPAFEFDDKPDFVELEDGVDTIVIDDSDSDER